MTDTASPSVRARVAGRPSQRCHSLEEDAQGGPPITTSRTEGRTAVPRVKGGANAAVALETQRFGAHRLRLPECLPCLVALRCILGQPRRDRRAETCRIAPLVVDALGSG